MDIESSQEISLDNWGAQLLENILLTAAEAVGERKEISDSIEVTLTFRLTPIVRCCTSPITRRNRPVPPVTVR